MIQFVILVEYLLGADIRASCVHWLLFIRVWIELIVQFWNSFFIFFIGPNGASTNSCDKTCSQLDPRTVLLLRSSGDHGKYNFISGDNVSIQQVLITSVSSSDHSYLQFTFDFMTLTQNINISYLNKEESLIFSESLD